MAIKESIFKVKERITLACAKVHRDPNSITIVAVSKGRTTEQIEEALESGITEIGENRVQEAIIKYTKHQAPSTKHQAVKLHMVGHLQTNKAKEAVEIFDLIQSVDSLRLAQEIDKQAAKINKVQEILIEVNTSGEATKFGIKPEDTIKVIKEIIKFKNINIKGLMTIAPLVDNSEKTRKYFRALKELRDNINYELRTMNYELNLLSMGMTDDFEVAIEEGANMVRIGRAIFNSS